MHAIREIAGNNEGQHQKQVVIEAAGSNEERQEMQAARAAAGSNEKRKEVYACTARDSRLQREATEDACSARCSRRQREVTGCARVDMLRGRPVVVCISLACKSTQNRKSSGAGGMQLRIQAAQMKH